MEKFQLTEKINPSSILTSEQIKTFLTTRAEMENTPIVPDEILHEVNQEIVSKVITDHKDKKEFIIIKDPKSPDKYIILYLEEAFRLKALEN